jgi:hypothetical protein
VAEHIEPQDGEKKQLNGKIKKPLTATTIKSKAKEAEDVESVDAKKKKEQKSKEVSHDKVIKSVNKTNYNTEIDKSKKKEPLKKEITITPIKKDDKKEEVKKETKKHEAGKKEVKKEDTKKNLTSNKKTEDKKVIKADNKIKSIYFIELGPNKEEAKDETKEPEIDEIKINLGPHLIDNIAINDEPKQDTPKDTHNYDESKEVVFSENQTLHQQKAQHIHSNFNNSDEEEEEESSNQEEENIEIDVNFNQEN